MNLFMFEHCSLCFRVRMTAALKGAHLREIPVLDDDTPTLVGLVGRRVIPILVKDDGQPMLESMDMVAHIEMVGPGEEIFRGAQRPEVAAAADAILEASPPLTMPRYPLLPLPEFATVAARDHFIVRKRKTYCDFTDLRARTRVLIDELMPALESLDALIESPEAVNGVLSLDDVRVLPLLRSCGVVAGLKFPLRVRTYVETLLERTGYQPLPAI